MLRFTIATLAILALTLPATAVTKKSSTAVIKKSSKGGCTKFNQSGNQIRTSCGTMQDDIAAQEKIKANQPPKPTTQQCQMVNGNLVCK